MFIALSVLDLSAFVGTLLAGVGIIGLALSFAFQGIATNFIASVILSVRHPFTEGDRVETNGHTGTVEELTLLTTILRTPTGQKVVVPNKEVFENPLTNYSDRDTRRVDVRCGVSFNDDLQATTETATEAVKTVEGLVSDRGVEFFYEEFGGSSVNFVVRFWIDSSAQGSFLQARSDREVADLGFFKRVAVRAHGGLPDASFEQAVADLKQAIEMKTRTHHHLELGLTYMVMGETEAAREQFQMTLDVPPVGPFALQDKLKARNFLDELE